MRPLLISFLLLPLLLLYANSASPHDGHVCDPGTLPDQLSLRSDKLTILISGFSERRLPLLRSLVFSYAAHPSVAAVLLLWGNPTTPERLLLPLTSSASPAVISVHRTSSPSLNARFHPRAAIRTRAVAVCDDDIEPDAHALSFAFTVWQSHERSLVGFFARSHDLDLDRREWIYTFNPSRHSIVLTKLVILHTDYLRVYSCFPELAEARRLVDHERNCEDILMNFVVAMEAGTGPVLVDAGRVRDWGDPRNTWEGGGNANGNGSGEAWAAEAEREMEVKRAGLSSRGEHWRKRGECIREFHRVLGKMPLRYSYGKVVEAAGEQGLCWKAGRLVHCDQV